MSSDNRICILHFPRYDNQQWAVWHGSASIEYYEPPCDAAFYDTEKEARQGAGRLAKKYDCLEYGVQDITREEQIEGIIWALEDMTKRLRCLCRDGIQFEVKDTERF